MCIQYLYPVASERLVEPPRHGGSWRGGEPSDVLGVDVRFARVVLNSGVGVPKHFPSLAPVLGNLERLPRIEAGHLEDERVARIACR